MGIGSLFLMFNNPFDAAEHRSRWRISPKGAGRDTGTSTSGNGLPVGRARGRREAQGSPEGTQSSGKFSLGTFFSKRKFLGFGSENPIQYQLQK